MYLKYFYFNHVQSSNRLVCSRYHPYTMKESKNKQSNETKRNSIDHTDGDSPNVHIVRPLRRGNHRCPDPPKFFPSVIKDMSDFSRWRASVSVVIQDLKVGRSFFFLDQENKFLYTKESVGQGKVGLVLFGH